MCAWARFAGTGSSMPGLPAAVASVSLKICHLHCPGKLCKWVCLKIRYQVLGTPFYPMIDRRSYQNTLINRFGVYRNTQLKRKTQIITNPRAVVAPCTFSVWVFFVFPKSPLAHASRSAILQWRQVCVLESHQRLWLSTDFISGFVSKAPGRPNIDPWWAFPRSSSSTKTITGWWFRTMTTMHI